MAVSFDPYNPETYQKLKKAVKRNYALMKPFREVRRWNKEAARGHYYNTSDESSGINRNPVNLLDQLEQVLVRSFVQSNPSARVTTRNKKNMQRAIAFRESLNRQIGDIGLEQTLRYATMDAILGYIGIVYCTIVPTERDPAGEFFADHVSFDDYVVDITRKKFGLIDFEGHRFSRRKDELLDTGMYDNEIVEKLSGGRNLNSELKDNPSDPDPDGEADLFEHLDIWSVHVKPANMIVYFSESNEAQAPLRVETADAPSFGPYVRLGFDWVLDELLPNSRAAQMLDLAEFVNGQYTRIFIQEDRKAEYYTYEGKDEKDARAVRDAMDGELIQVENNDAVNKRTKGGTSPQSLGTAAHGMQLFDQMSGNIRLLGGVGPVADTATQERLANANVSRLVTDMQISVVKFTRQILQNMAWYDWTNPLRSQQFTAKVGQNGLAVDLDWTPEQRDGDFIEYEIGIEPDSMVYRSGEQQVQALLQGVQLAMQIAQLPSERPIVVRGPELLDHYSRMRNVPEMESVVDYASSEANVFQASGANGRASASQQPQEDGRSRNGGQRTPEDLMIQQAMTGAGQQQGDEQ